MLFEKYEQNFNLYLEIVQSLYNPQKPYEGLEKCIKTCESSKWKLLGMLNLIEDMGEIGKEKYRLELERIIETFSSIAICNAYMSDGEVMVFKKGFCKGESCDE